ncbi:hypothetical protein OHS33_21005 [Streptomyces sp. NBC_00536]|uniref:hypothetical protein n=1 Tax=Streptomyces sp. NBC_00536 TaxID=2975769 RepID=UPI002E81004F|nr:hypothetical protein [Streptomyces sp. NBC_00536]WUC80581.1 hypothetical protein OHS33_21005 [Streptomyces sp. NBC_00536]
MPDHADHRETERTGKSGVTSAVAEALRNRLAGARLRQVTDVDRKAFGPVPAEARRRAEQEW